MLRPCESRLAHFAPTTWRLFMLLCELALRKNLPSGQWCSAETSVNGEFCFLTALSVSSLCKDQATIPLTLLSVGYQVNLMYNELVEYCRVHLSFYFCTIHILQSHSIITSEREARSEFLLIYTKNLSMSGPPAGTLLRGLYLWNRKPDWQAVFFGG